MSIQKVLTMVGVLSLTIAAAGFGSAANKESNDPTSEAPTFYRDVLPILQGNCQGCHRENGANLGGMLAPMAFVDYEGTRPWAKSIASHVEQRGAHHERRSGAASGGGGTNNASEVSPRSFRQEQAVGKADPSRVS